ncbi:prolyl oligopeptidase [Colletotrichum graminicola]|nr:prolyl oligopeptidase [Colletotrichum graminicola]
MTLKRTSRSWTGNTPLAQSDRPGCRRRRDTRLEAPFGIYGEADAYSNFDVSEKGIAFIAEDAGLSPEHAGISHVYYVPLRSFTAAAECISDRFSNNSLRGMRPPSPLGSSMF